MRNASKTGLMFISLLAAALLVGVGLGLWFTRQDLPKPATPTVPAITKPPANSASASNGVAAAGSKTNASETAPDEELPPQAGVEQKLDAIILSDADPSVKASRILALMPARI